MLNRGWWFYEATIYLDYGSFLYIVHRFEEALDYLKRSEEMYLEKYQDEMHPRRLAEIYGVMRLIYSLLENKKQYQNVQSLFYQYIHELDEASIKVLLQSLADLYARQELEEINRTNEYR